MIMVNQSLALAVLALTCSLFFTPCTESLAVRNDGKQVGSMLFDVANNLPTNPQFQHHGPNEVTVSYQKGDPLPVETNASSSVPNEVISTSPSPQSLDIYEDPNQSKWCIAKPSTSAAKLDEIIRYCCTEYEIDCGLIQYGGACYDPATNKVSDASVVMNLYYKAAGKNEFNCDFQASGLIVTHDPSVGECFYAA